MPKVVLDSNVIISALHFGGHPDKVLRLAVAGRFDLVLSPFILDEISGVLTRKLGWHRREVAEAVSLLREIATIVEPTSRLAVIAEKDADNRILECALDGHATYIVSGDARHLLPLGDYRGILILTPAAFLPLFA